MEAMKDNPKDKAPDSKRATGAVGNQVPAGKSREELEREALEEVARDLWEDEMLRQISEEAEDDAGWLPD